MTSSLSFCFLLQPFHDVEKVSCVITTLPIRPQYMSADWWTVLLFTTTPYHVVYFCSTCGEVMLGGGASS